MNQFCVDSFFLVWNDSAVVEGIIIRNVEPKGSLFLQWKTHFLMSTDILYSLSVAKELRFAYYAAHKKYWFVFQRQLLNVAQVTSHHWSTSLHYRNLWIEPVHSLSLSSLQIITYYRRLDQRHSIQFLGTLNDIYLWTLFKLKCHYQYNWLVKTKGERRLKAFYLVLNVSRREKSDAFWKWSIISPNPAESGTLM